MADRMRVTSAGSAMRPRITAPGLPFQSPGQPAGATVVVVRQPEGLECFGYLDRCRKPQRRNLLRTDTPRSKGPECRRLHNHSGLIAERLPGFVEGKPFAHRCECWGRGQFEATRLAFHR